MTLGVRGREVGTGSIFILLSWIKRGLMSDDAFLDLPDLACEDVGGAALACNDEFFAEKENLLKPAAAVWKDHLYTDRGKWMDGWETRRRREAGHDWCLVRLGLP